MAPAPSWEDDHALCTHSISASDHPLRGSCAVPQECKKNNHSKEPGSASGGELGWGVPVTHERTSYSDLSGLKQSRSSRPNTTKVCRGVCRFLKNLGSAKFGCGRQLHFPSCWWFGAEAQFALSTLFSGRAGLTASPCFEPGTQRQGWQHEASSRIEEDFKAALLDLARQCPGIPQVPGRARGGTVLQHVPTCLVTQPDLFRILLLRRLRLPLPFHCPFLPVWPPI